MTPQQDDNRQRVVKFVQELLTDEGDRTSITPSLIDEKISMVVAMQPRWGEGLDRQAVTDELVRRFSLWVGQDTVLRSEAGHVAWLDAARKRDWRYWQRYSESQEKKLSPKAGEALDRATDQILSMLEDPSREGPWDRRGLVVGHVQSGKTGNYTGLICKAADAGYKIIIVLAGLHNNLRSQTQMRLDEGFLGYETRPTGEDMRIIGVGEIDADPAIRPNYATNRSNNGDFNARNASTLGISPEQRPWLFVVKKNKTVLERVNKWIRDRVANATDPETGRKIVTNLPLLLIDDEADHASVDTGELVFDEEGKPDEEHQPTAINRQIRRILHSFTRSAYVGYTATPFANIFIHERGETREEGPDLFPSAFIVNLGAPSNYVGPAKVFRSAEEDDEGLPLVRQIADYTGEDGRGGWMPHGHKNGHRPLFDGEDRLPPSLEEAIDSFFLACATRRLRGQGREHASMLVHVTRFNSVQTAVRRQIDDYVRQARQMLQRGIGGDAWLARLEAHWRQDFVPAARNIRDVFPDGTVTKEERWEDVLDALPDAVADIDVRTVNGTAKDALDYADEEGKGLKVIAIGGDKLARGLTLEGLSTSYFLRASKMYDTLMQMGRWFGYRPGYLDVCRLYTTPELVDWFGHIASAAEELREEFDLMAAEGATPREYGLKVQSHSVLMVTSRLKMRSARNLMLSFSGELLETVSMFRDTATLSTNLEAGRSLLRALGPGEVNPERRRGGKVQRWEGHLWSDIEATEIADFLRAIRTHPEAIRVNGPLLAEFVERMAMSGEVARWTVALIGGGTGASANLAPSVDVAMLKRSNRSEEDTRYSIGRLLSPRDESIDLVNSEWDAALELSRRSWRNDPGRGRKATEEPDEPNGPSIRQVRGFGAPGVAATPDRGLLLLYVLDPAESGLSPDLPPVLAFGISFPGSNSGLKVEYKVNNVLWEAQYGAAD